MIRTLEVGAVDIEAIKDQFPLANFVGETVALKRKGRTWKGLCPFHDERTPSFTIYPDERYHCFGCGAHGDLFDFAGHIEGWTIRETAEKLGHGVVPTYTAARIEEIRAKRLRMEQEEAAAKAKVIEDCRRRWDAADPDFLTHPYLDAKGIQSHGSRYENGGTLLTPLWGQDGKLQCIQAIAADGAKDFPFRGTTSGGFHILGGKVATAAEPVLLCEGFATAASLAEATGRVVICAYNSGNMAKVASFFGAKYPGKAWLIAGDDDSAGHKAADECRAILQCEAVLPITTAGSDFNDMAAEYGLEAVRALVVDGVVPEGTKEPEIEPDVFPLLDFDQLDALPPPTWLIEELIADHGLSIVYGEPGSGKSFVTIDMALRIAYAMDWHGATTSQAGVIYIAGEGARGLGNRIKGWRREHGKIGVSAPFLLLPIAVQMLETDDLAKLKRTIQEAIRRCGFKVGLVIIDTVSRAIAGQDENSQESMSLFVNSCAAIQEHTGGAVIGVHHSGKEAARGMRGSTVLLGACDASMRVAKDGDTVVLTVEKQKDAEQSKPVYFAMKRVEWAVGLAKEESTLVPVRAERDRPPSRELSRKAADEVFEIVARGWREKKPWGVAYQAQRRGRYLPKLMSDKFGLTEKEALVYVEAWQQADYMAVEICDERNKVTGLHVLKFLERD